MVADAARVAHAGGGDDDLGRRVAVDGHGFLFRLADVQTRELQGVPAALHQGEGFVVVALGKVFPEDRGGFARQRAVHKDREVFVALDTALGLIWRIKYKSSCVRPTAKLGMTTLPPLSNVDCSTALKSPI